MLQEGVDVTLYPFLKLMTSRFVEVEGVTLFPFLKLITRRFIEVDSVTLYPSLKLMTSHFLKVRHGRNPIRRLRRITKEHTESSWSMTSAARIHLMTSQIFG